MFHEKNVKSGYSLPLHTLPPANSSSDSADYIDLISHAGNFATTNLAWGLHFDTTVRGDIKGN